MKAMFRIFRVQLSGLLSINAIRCQTDDKARKKARKNLLMWIVLCVLCVVMSASYSMMFASMLEPMGMLRVLPLLMMVSASALTLLSGVIRAKGLLFSFADYDLLMGLPVRTSSVAGARLLSYYVVDSLFAACLMLPAGVVYAMHTPVPPAFYPVYLLLTLLAPLIPLVAGGVIGTLVSALLARVKWKNALTTVLQLVFVLAVMYVSFSSNSWFDSIGQNVAGIEQSLTGAYPLFNVFLSAVCDLEPMAILLFAVASLAPAAVFCFLLCAFFQKLNTAMSATYRDTHFRLAGQKGGTRFGALLRREWKRLLSSSVYLMNTGMGTILLVAGAVAAIVFRGRVMPLWREIAPLAAWALPLVVSWIVSLASPTACAVSLEGKQLWMCKQLPFSANEWLSAKLYLGLTLTMPAIVLAGAALCIAYPMQPLAILALFAVPLCYAYFFNVFGLWLNLRHPRFDWQTETECVKQSLPVFIGIIASMALVVAPGILSALMGSLGVVLGFAALLLAAAVAIRLYLLKNGEKIRTNLS